MADFSGTLSGQRERSQLTGRMGESCLITSVFFKIKEIPDAVERTLYPHGQAPQSQEVPKVRLSSQP